jgi:hypothetical protein
VLLRLPPRRYAPTFGAAARGIQDGRFKIQNRRGKPAASANWLVQLATRAGFPYSEGVGSENGEPVMQFNVPPDLEMLINKRLSSGGYTSIEDVLRRALEAQDAEESWTDEERQALAAHIEKGYL